MTQTWVGADVINMCTSEPLDHICALALSMAAPPVCVVNAHI